MTDNMGPAKYMVHIHTQFEVVGREFLSFLNFRNANLNVLKEVFLQTLMMNFVRSFLMSMILYR